MRARHRSTASVLLLALSLSAAALGGACGGDFEPPVLPAPEPGLREYRAAGLVDAFGVTVDLAGGGAVVRRTDATSDTLLGTYVLRATWSSASGEWVWGFDMRFDGTTFVDDTGAVHDLSALAPGDAIPGTHWVYVDDSTIATKGGLRHEFGPFGLLATMRWATDRIEFTGQLSLGQPRVKSACQPVAGGCAPLFSVTRGLEHRGVVSWTDRAGRTASYVYDEQHRLVEARDPLDEERGWPGWRYEYDGGLLTALTSSEGVRTEMPKLLSSQISTSGRGIPKCAHQRAVLSPASATAWLTEASPKEHTTRLSYGRFASISKCAARGTESAAPTALGRCEAIVLVCGGTFSSTLPQTLCRPPEIGSSLEATRPSSVS